MVNPMKALVITAPGINCDLELAQAFEAAGVSPEPVLLSALARDPSVIDRFGMIGLPGGFSYGDDIAAGRIMAALIRERVYPALRAAIERRVPMICPCNGFQIAVQAGLLPGPVDGAWPIEPALATVALSNNASARFEDRWTRMEIPAETVCVWTRGVACEGEDSMLPCAHGEGRFVTTTTVLAALESRGQVAMRYAQRDNFNGSMGAVAGLCDASGLVFGLMPHPERYTRFTQHPWWTRLPVAMRRTAPLGLRVFQAAVACARGEEVAR